MTQWERKLCSTRRTDTEQLHLADDASAYNQTILFAVFDLSVCFIFVHVFSMSLCIPRWVQSWPRPPSPWHAFLCQMKSEWISNHLSDRWISKNQMTLKSLAVQNYTKSISIYIYSARHGGHRKCMEMRCVSLTCQVQSMPLLGVNIFSSAPGPHWGRKPAPS